MSGGVYRLSFCLQINLELADASLDRFCRLLHEGELLWPHTSKKAIQLMTERRLK
jgi:hypothetical protein